MDYSRNIHLSLKKESHDKSTLKQLHHYFIQTNGLVGRQNQTTQMGLLKYLEGSKDQWEKALEGVLFAYRTAVRSPTGMYNKLLNLHVTKKGFDKRCFQKLQYQYYMYTEIFLLNGNPV